MQVQLIDPMGRQFNIDSRNPEVILLWLGEYIPQMTTPNWYMRIWLATETEARLFGTPYMIDEEMTKEGFRKISNFFRRVERERKTDGQAK